MKGYYEELGSSSTWWLVADTEEEMREWIQEHKYLGRVGKLNDNFAIVDVTKEFASSWLEHAGDWADSHADLGAFELAYPWLALHEGHTMRVIYSLRGPLPEEQAYATFSEEP